LYVSHISLDRVTIIDPGTNQIVGQIRGGKGPCNVEVSPQSSYGYIANFQSNDVTVFDKKTGATVSTVPAGEHPTSLILTLDAKLLLIGHQSNDGLWFLDTGKNQIIKKLNAGTGTFCRLESGKIYQNQIFIPYVFVVDPRQMSLSKNIDVGGRPLNIALSPDQKSLYIANYDLNEIEQIDAQTDSVVSRIPRVNNARGIAITPDGRFAYVTNVLFSTVTVVNLQSSTIVKAIPVGKMPTSVAMGSDGKFAYVSCQGQPSVDVLDTQTQELVKSIPVDNNPIEVQLR
jgi:YVTN family beta-propeller protein